MSYESIVSQGFSANRHSIDQDLHPVEPSNRRAGEGSFGGVELTTGRRDSCMEHVNMAVVMVSDGGAQPGCFKNFELAANHRQYILQTIIT